MSKNRTPYFPMVHREQYIRKGTELRDHFAGLAMQAFIMRHGIVDLKESTPRFYQVADAMMTERERED